MRARLLILLGGVLASSMGRAGPLSTEPLLGVTSDYSSNPYLLSRGEYAVSDVAVLFSAPTYYDLDAAHYSLLPSIRYSDGGSYASLNSNFYHLRGSAAFSSDLNALTLNSAIGRDSSFYQNGLSSNGVGVRTDATSAGFDWQHSITERASLAVDAGWSRVLYSQTASSTGLVDYRYLSLSSSASYAVSELNKIQISAGVGKYKALDGITESKSYSLQLGFERRLTEIWTLSLGAGYARSNNSQEIFSGPYFIGTAEYGPFYLETVKSRQDGPVYSAGLIRRGETLTLKASASRAYIPSGFEFLSRQDIAVMDLGYISSERWNFGAEVKYQNNASPLSNDALSTARYFSGQISANWNWTPNWIISLQTTWVQLKYAVPPVSAQSTGVSLEISRQFLRIDL